MVGIFAGDDFRAAGEAFGEFHSPFCGLGTGVDQIDFIERFGEVGTEKGGEPGRRFQYHFSIDHGMEVPIELGLDGRNHCRMPVPEHANTYPGDKIQGAFSIRSKHPDPFCPLYFKQEREGAGLR